MRRDAPRVGATIHECGHALYEQGRDVGAEGLGLPASRALSMGVHESQSLLWERMVLAAVEAEPEPQPSPSPSPPSPSPSPEPEPEPEP